MAVTELLKPTTGTWRVVGARWLLYMLAVLPGMMSLGRHLDDKIGTRPWFHDLQTPLSTLSTKFVVAEIGGGVALLGAGATIIWLLQLVWLGGSTLIFDPRKPQITKNLFANGWQFLARFVRIAIIALVVTLVLQLIVRKVFSGVSSTAEVEGWAVYDAFFTLNLWRASIMFVLLTTVGVIAFWMRIIAVTEDRTDTRRLPWQTLKLLASKPFTAFVLQFLLICAVLGIQAMALWCWRQSPNGGLWFGLWSLMQLATAYIWQLRVRLAVNLSLAGR
ncbi:MAG: hypothetical protein ACR2QL_05510 [Woeseiaceae bacterium]